MKRSIVPTKSTRKSSLSHTGAGMLSARRSEKPTLIGHDVTSEELFGFTPKHRQNHTHILGSTGTGKSKFLELLLRQDVQNRGCGVCLIDPHGKLYQDILTYIATEKSTLADRLVLFNPFNDLENVIGFNPLPAGEKDRFDYIEKNFVSACLKAWGQEDITDTPRIARWLQNIAHTLLVNDMTLLESAALISTEKNDHLRKALVQNVVNEVVRVDWEGIIEGNSQRRSEMIEGAGNRLVSFLQNELIRLIIGQKDNVLDLPQIMKEGKILLVNLNDQHGRVTLPDAKLMGTLLVSELYRVARLRDPYDPRLKPFYIYIDEFAQYVSNDIAYSLEEVRKFKVFYLLAHQHLGQLKRDNAYLYQSVLTNCKNKVIFGGLSFEDAEIMNKEIQEGFVDLKTIKHTQTRIRERHIETTRRVRQEQFSQTTGQSDQRSSSSTISESEAEGLSEGETRSRSHTDSTTDGHTSSTSHGQTKGTADTTGRSTGQTNTLGKSSSITDTTGSSEGRSESLNFGRSDTHSDSHGTSQSSAHAQGQSVGKSIGGADTRGQNQSQTTTQGRSDSETRSYSDTDSRGSSYGSGDSRSMDEDGYTSRGHSDNSSYNLGSSHTEGRASTKGKSVSWSDQHGTSQAHTDNWSNTTSQNKTTTDTHGRNESTSDAHTESSGEQYGKSSSTNQSRAQTLGQNSSESHSQTESSSHTKNQSETLTKSSGTTKSRGSSDTQGLAQTQQRSQTQTRGTAETKGTAQTQSHSESQGYSVGDVPFFEIDEVEEVASVQFWTLNDLMYMKRAEMRNLEVAQAFVKIENQPPVHCRVAHMPERKMSRQLAEDMVDRLKLEVVEIHKGQYLPLRAAKAKIIKRQKDAIGDTIKFYDTLTPEPPQEDETNDIVDDEDSPFG
ncbi:MAG: type IV secretion system DNA-binding domain-containing protein [Dinoroseobacter sp.]|nr:type IV secretion system DNA-binding domain-containing protein [Dinoroseobacter sp.]